MVNLGALTFLGKSLGIDFQNDAFPQVIEKLARSGMATFRVEWGNVSICMAFDEKAGQLLNKALADYLERKGG